MAGVQGALANLFSTYWLRQQPLPTRTTTGANTNEEDNSCQRHKWEIKTMPSTSTWQGGSPFFVLNTSILNPHTSFQHSKEVCPFLSYRTTDFWHGKEGLHLISSHFRLGKEGHPFSSCWTPHHPGFDMARRFPLLSCQTLNFDTCFRRRKEGWPFPVALKFYKYIIDYTGFIHDPLYSVQHWELWRTPYLRSYAWNKRTRTCHTTAMALTNKLSLEAVALDDELEALQWH